jgi:hypothetical protein
MSQLLTRLINFWPTLSEHEPTSDKVNEFLVNSVRT